MTEPFVSGTGVSKNKDGSVSLKNIPNKVNDNIRAEIDSDFTFPEGQTLFSFDGNGVYINYLFHEKFIKDMICNLKKIMGNQKIPS